MLKKWWLLLFIPVMVGCMPMPVAPAPPPVGVSYSQLGATATLAACLLPLVNLGLITLIAAALVFTGLGRGWPRLHDDRERDEGCLETIRRRYARGELTREEYQQMLRDLKESPD